MTDDVPQQSDEHVSGKSIDPPVDADVVEPRPASRRLVLWALFVGGLAIVLAGAGTIIALLVSTGNKTTLDNQAKTSQQRTDQRNKERDATEKQIKDLTNSTNAKIDNTNNAICVLLIGSVQQGRAQGMNPGPIVFTFAKSIGCIIPAGPVKPTP